MPDTDRPTIATPPVDVWVSDQGMGWWFDPTTEKGREFCADHLRPSSAVQRQGSLYVVPSEHVMQVIRHMAFEGLLVREVMH